MAGKNLLKNPSFEDGTATWSKASWLTNTLEPSADTRIHCHGKTSMTFNIEPDKFCYVTQDVRVPEETRECTLGIRVRTTGLPSGWIAVAYLDCYDSNTKNLGSLPRIGWAYGDAENQWLHFQRTLPLPAGTSLVKVVLRAHHDCHGMGVKNGTGQVWYDQVEIYPGKMTYDEKVLIPNQEEWKHQNAVSSVISGGLRLQIPNTEKEKAGGIGRYVFGPDGEHYLQVRMGNMESAEAAPSCHNLSAGGGKIGWLYQGINTFRLPPHAAGRDFYLFLKAQTGKTGKIGPWVDFKDVRTTPKPQNAPIVTLLSGNIAKVGSRLTITLKSREPLAEPPKVRFCLLPDFIDYSFNAQPEIALKEIASGTYQTELTIDRDALSFSSQGSRCTLAALTKLNGIPCFYNLPFPVEVKTDKQLEKTLLVAGNMQVRDDRKKWLKAIRGTDIARGKKVLSAPTPDYYLTRSDSDSTDLTRGELSSRADDHIWFDRKAVGWFGNALVYMKLDLESVQPVDRAVIRLLGGTSGNFKFPSILELYVSKDGKKFHPCSAMHKLQPGERSQCDWKHYYYLEENASDYNTRVYPFSLPVQAEARYLLLKITGETGWIFSDAFACIKAEKRTPNFNEAYQSPGIDIPMAGLIISTQKPQLAIMKGLPAPQFFTVMDMRSAKEAKQKAEMVLELPAGITVINKKGEDLPDGGKRYVFPLPSKKDPNLPILYLEAPKDVSGTATIYGRSGGIDQFKTRLPILQVIPPPIKPLKRLHTSLVWMSNSAGWPDFLNLWKHLGFNTVTVIPRWWGTASLKNNQQFVIDARKQGYQVVMNDSAFHEMAWRQGKTHPEIYCQIPGRKKTPLCPSYRGKCYQQEMDRVRECVRVGKPDYVFFDTETWMDCASTVKICTRCQKALRKSGLSTTDYLFHCGRQTLRDLKQAVALGADDANISMPKIASYHRDPLGKAYGIEKWNDIYPESVDFAQPELYIVGRAKDVHDCIRGNHKLLGNKKLIPMLTAGCYGEFESYKMEQMVLETLMNGACGFTYYHFFNFDTPLDFYYQLKALAAIQPYEDLIVDGTVTDIASTNQGITCSLIVKDGEALLLAGNYVVCDPAIQVRLPFKPSFAKDLRSNQTFTARQNFAFSVPRRGIRLFYFKK